MVIGETEEGGYDAGLTTSNVFIAFASSGRSFADEGLATQ